jgi:phosphoribosylformylglycinamidine cyclo-ligase
MYRTFNMGIGMVIACAKKEAEIVAQHLRAQGETVYAIGSVIRGNREVLI